MIFFGDRKKEGWQESRNPYHVINQQVKALVKRAAAVWVKC